MTTAPFPSRTAELRPVNGHPDPCVGWLIKTTPACELCHVNPLPKGDPYGGVCEDCAIDNLPAGSGLNLTDVYGPAKYEFDHDPDRATYGY